MNNFDDSEKDPTDNITDRLKSFWYSNRAAIIAFLVVLTIIILWVVQPTFIKRLFGKEEYEIDPKIFEPASLFDKE